jgi:hypothetical protein
MIFCLSMVWFIVDNLKKIRIIRNFDEYKKDIEERVNNTEKS